MAAEQRLEREQNRPFVVNDQNPAIFSSHGVATEAGSSWSSGEA
jgi:hypothetical protein